LQDAVARHKESQEILIHGTEASIVQTVGAIETLVQQAATLEFWLNDASGRIKVRYYGSDSTSVTGLASGRYVSIVGSLRTSPAPHISAMSLQPVETADEISYHMIEVAHAALRLRNPSTAGGYRPAVAAADPITPAKQAESGFGLGLPAAGTSTTLSPAKTEAPPTVVETAAAPVLTPPKADLRTSVVDVLRQVSDTGSEEGINTSSLLARLPAEASSAKIRELLAQLVEEGEIFTTIDDDHFSML
jgi:replication factor A2